MMFNSTQFLVFFPVVVLLYFVMPRRARQLWLLAASYYFYMSWNPRYALLIAFSTAVTWLSGLALGRAAPDDTRRRKGIVAASFVINLGILAVFKYGTFLLGNVTALCRIAGLSYTAPTLDLLLPVGISFYTFQALSYTADVYGGKIEPEHNILRYALFVSFFPQLVAGPIERSGSLLRQIQQVPKKSRAELLDYKRITDGLIVMLWGFFLKMVIADRISILVDTVFDSYFAYHTFALALAAAAFAIQIYCDFSSYSTIAIGAAQVLGFTLMENFDTPFFSRSIQEHWRRWHISLSTWFKDYLYIPLGGSRCGLARRCLNLMITFTVSGLWHGASWNYVLWGAMHGAYQVIGMLTRPWKDRVNARLGVRTDTITYKLGQVIITFGLISFAFILFRSATLGDAFCYIGRLFTRWDPWALSDGTLYTLGLDRVECNVLFWSLVALLLVDLIKYFRHQRIDEFLDGEGTWFKWGCLLALIAAIVIFGKYGAGFDAKQFIYFQF